MHHGGTNGGHYTSYVRLPRTGAGTDDGSNGESMWAHADDESVRLGVLEEHVTAGRVLSEAYMLFYTRTSNNSRVHIVANFSIAEFSATLGLRLCVNDVVVRERLLLHRPCMSSRTVFVAGTRYCYSSSSRRTCTTPSSNSVPASSTASSMASISGSSATGTYCG